MKLKPEMTREQITNKQRQSARGYDLQGDQDTADEIASMSPESFLEFIGKADRVRITNPVTRRALRRKLRQLERERRTLSLCIVRIKGLIGD